MLFLRVAAATVITYGVLAFVVTTLAAVGLARQQRMLFATMSGYET